MAKWDHVIWDWNGTLLDDADFSVSIMNGLLGRRGLPGISVSFYRAVIEFPVILYYKKLGYDFEAEPFEKISDEYVAAYQAGWRGCALQPGALEAMDALARAGVGQSVLSASMSWHLREQLEYFGLLGRLQAVTGADNHHGRGKIELARGHIERLRLDPRRVLFVGDTQHDAEVAAEAGADCLLVAYGHYSRARLAHLGWPVVGSAAEIAPLLCAERSDD